MGVLYVALSAFMGGIAAAMLGWLESGDDFIGRKFGASVLRALVAGAAFAIAYQIAAGGVSIMDIIIAFVAGAGVDVLGNRLAGSITAN